MSRTQIRDFFARPGMFIPRVTYHGVVSFLQGFNVALGGSVMGGFTEWLIEKYRVPSDLHYSASVLYLLELSWPVTMTPEQEKFAIERLRALLEEYFEATKDSSQEEHHDTAP